MFFRKYHRKFAQCVALAGFMLAGSAQADVAPENRLAILDLTLNEVRRGDIVVVFRGNDVFVSVDDLHAAGLIDVHGRIEKIKDKRFVSLASITPHVHFNVDERASSLRLDAAPEMFGSTVIDLRPAKPQNIEYHTDAAAFINYSWTLKDFVHSSGFVETGLSLQGALLTNTIFGSEKTGIVRGISNIIYDDRKHLTRFTFGDAFVSSGELGAGQFIGGVSISRNFGIDPYFVRQPSLGYSGSALTPSTLDVYVNGTRVRSTAVAPGQFQVQNLPVTMGSGNVRYVLRDAFGDEHAVDTRYSLVANQLGKNMSEYTYALGLARHEMGVESFDYRQFVGLAHHRLGLTDKLTLGMRVEGRPDLASGGATLQMVFPLGHASLSGAASGGRNGNGVAGVARFGIWTRKFMAMAMVQGTSARYSTASLEPTDDRNLLDARFTMTVAPTTRFSFSTDTSLMVPRDLPWQFRLGAATNVRLAKRMQFQLAAHAVWSPERDISGEAFGMLTYAFDNGLITSTGGRVSNASREAFVNVSKPMRHLIDTGFRASGTYGPQPRGDATVEMQGTQGRFLASVLGDEQGAHTTFQASGAIVAVKGAGIFATRPVQNGFAVLQVPGVKGVRGYLENQEIGKTDENGNLIIPNVMSYYGSRMRVTAQDIPLDQQVDANERIVSPPLRGGALVRFAIKRLRLYRGQARIQQGDKTVIPSYGEIEVVKGSEVQSSPLNKNADFELPDLEAGRYRAKITYAEGTCSFDFDAVDGQTVVINMGTLMCPVKSEEER